MIDSYPLVTGGETNTFDFTEFEHSEPVFLLQNNQLFYTQANPHMLTFLVSSISRKPKNLMMHLQRIAICYEQDNEELLYAALVDFFVVLQGSGAALKHRMLAGSRNKLSPLLMQRLQIYLTDFHLIQGNLYTVLTSGLESNLQLISEPKEDVATDHDPLQIARDFIEYSQLDEAQETLEAAILSTPDYTELHVDLLELYKLTNSVEAFNEMKLALSEVDHSMQAQWDALNSYFYPSE